VPAAIPKASSKLACTCLERALISSTPKLVALNPLPELLLSRGSFKNPQNGVRDFLSVADRGQKCPV